MKILKAGWVFAVQAVKRNAFPESCGLIIMSRALVFFAAKKYY